MIYQPIYTDDNKPFALEALLRSTSSKLANESTQDIIKAATRVDIMSDIGLDSLAKITKFILSQRKNNDSVQVPFVMNLSLNEINKDEWLVAFKKHITKYKITPKELIFDILEHKLVSVLTKAQNNLKEIADMGFNIYIDEFGTGFSSLNVLRMLPISGIKISLAFTEHLHANSKEAKIIEALYQFTLTLGIKLIIKEVEHKAQFDALKHLPNILMQGFYLSKPKRDPKDFLVESE